jgi:hypothetical protein
MTSLMRTSGIAALLFGLGAVAGAQEGAVGNGPPERITTDTLVYCRQLAARLEALTAIGMHVPTRVSDLSSVGKEMCDHGLTRGGILRLRSAIVLMMNQETQDARRTDPGQINPGR